MTDLSRLCDTLNATAVIGHLAQSTDPTQALANAINRSTLPRRLDAKFSGLGCMRLFVRNRRLHRMEIDQAHADTPWNIALGPPDCEAAAEALKDVCQSGSWNGINVFEVDAEDAFDGIGIAADQLIDRLLPQGWVDAPFDLQSRILELEAQVPSEVEASFVTSDGAIAALTGSDEAIEALASEVTDIAAQVLDEAFPLLASLETDGALVLPRNGTSSGCHLVVGHLGVIGIVVMLNTSPGTAMRLWSRGDT